MSANYILSTPLLRTICHEMCDGVEGASPTHPRLARDVENAYFAVCKSKTLRGIGADIENRPSLEIVEAVNESREAWKLYAEHRDGCDVCLTYCGPIDDEENPTPEEANAKGYDWMEVEHCYFKTRNDLCAEGARLRAGAVQS